MIRVVHMGHREQEALLFWWKSINGGCLTFVGQLEATQYDPGSDSFVLPFGARRSITSCIRRAEI